MKARPLRNRVALVFVGNTRPRSDQAHVALENIYHLRQFIEPRSSEQPAQRDQSRIPPRVQLLHGDVGIHQTREIGLMIRSVGTHMHGPELIEPKTTPHVADALLAEKYRAGGRN